MANVACAVHTPCILTADFVHQLYGYNGVIKKIENPKLGPRFYWPEDGHIDLNPYWDDERVVREMKSIFKGYTKAEDVDYEWAFRPRV